MGNTLKEMAANSSGVTSLTVLIGDDPKPVKVYGREAWALEQLMDAGPLGFTSIERPAPRASHYVYMLRKQGVGIETRMEAHGGSYSGSHARYILRSKVTRLKAEYGGSGRGKSREAMLAAAHSEGGCA